MNLPLTTSVVVLTALAARSQTLVRSVSGPGANAQYGRACIAVPDQNGDSFDDLLVGAPGVNQESGAIYCISGAYLALGTGAPTVWSIVLSNLPGSRFGHALALVDDVTGDGHRDFLVGLPGYGTTAIGAVWIVSGVYHILVQGFVGAVGSQTTVGGARFGSTIEVCGDLNGDGISEVAIGAPGSPTSYLQVLNGASLATLSYSSTAAITTLYGSGGNAGLGSAIASGFDLDGDGVGEIAYSSPGFDGPAGTDTGVIEIREVTPSGSHPLGYYVSTIALERFGESLDAAHDYDGDGVVDIVVGAPNSIAPSGYQAGRVVVLSGARLIAQTPPYELQTLIPPYALPSHHQHFGTAVRASDDLNGDGVGDILVGEPDYTTFLFGLFNRGRVSVYSGATGVVWARISGFGDDRLGDSLTGAIEDLDGDGFREFAMASSRADVSATDDGVVKCYELFPLQPAIYCTGKTNSLGCVPAIGWSGSSSVSAMSPFSVTCANVLNQVSGLYFYSHQPNATAFQGGTLCVKSPLRRTPVLASGGSASGIDCTGTLNFDFGAHISSGADPTLVAGSEVFIQCWSRDSASTSTTSLSNGLRFLINP